MIEVVVDEVLKELEKATNEGMKAADDYMDDDTGLLMCGQCHTKKQKKNSILGRGAHCRLSLQMCGGETGKRT